MNNMNQPPPQIGSSKLRQKMGLSGQMFDFYGSQLKQSGIIKVKPSNCKFFNLR